MTITEELMNLDEEVKKLNITFDKALPTFQEKLWAIADRHNMTGPDVFMLYMDMKSKK